MKRRFAYKKEDNYKELRIDESFFKGYAVYLKYNNVESPLVVNNGKEDLCIRDNGYE